MLTQQQAWRLDRRVGLISIAMWAGTAVRVWTQLTPYQNAQSVSAMLMMALVVVAWPTLSLQSYLRWRTPALAVLRTYLIALPFNFDANVFDAIAPKATGGAGAVVGNIFQFTMAIRIALLTFTSLGWRVPFRLHICLQAINVAMFWRFGLDVYAASELLRSRELSATAAALHGAMGAASQAVLWGANVSVPAGEDAQRRALIVFCWLVLGYLLPTLLLLPERTSSGSSSDGSGQGEGRGRGRGVLARAAAAAVDRPARWAEAAMRQLLPPKGGGSSSGSGSATESTTNGGGSSSGTTNEPEELAASPALATCTLAWFLVLLLAWRVAVWAVPTQPLYPPQ